LTKSYDRLLSYAVFADWIFFAFTGIALIVFRRKLPAAPRPFPTPGYPWIPILFTLAGAGIVVNIFFTDTMNALMGVAIFALGVPVYFFWGRRNRLRSGLRRRRDGM
jgi:APA family basic amino acid/polyamine antiporter